jgi:hypothetical protein
VADRITIRVTTAASQLLEEKCKETGQTRSEVLRNALDLVLAPSDVSPDVRHTAEAAGCDAFPAHLAELLPRYQAFGTEIWRERRRLFQSLLAAAEIASRNGQQHDTALLAELMRIGGSFGLLTK